MSEHRLAGTEGEDPAGSGDAPTGQPVSRPADVVVLLGTDHHPFDRLVAWADAWAVRNPSRRLLVQYGNSRPPTTAAGVSMLDKSTLRAVISAASVVITHGGPGTMVDARASGHTPVMVPRDPRLGEHVDEHQQRFVRWAADKGLVRACDVPDLDAAVRVGLATPASAPDRGPDPRAAVHQLQRLLRDAPTAPVLFVAGFGRSGSTLLECVLAQDPRVVALGEVVHLWDRGIRKNELCGCGAPFLECEFWREVGDRAFAGWQHVDLHQVEVAAGHVDRQRAMLRTAGPLLRPTTRHLASYYAELYRRIYNAARDITGASVVIDSSKHPSLAMVLSHDTAIDLRILHLVRDSLGVAYSWAKSVPRPEARSPDAALMTRYSASRCSAKWVATNLETESLRARGVAMARLRYEDLVASPSREIARVWLELGLPSDPPDLLDSQHRVTLSAHHSVAGNPVRFKVGPMTLRSDEAWRTRLSLADRRKVGALTVPMRLRYGYPVRVAGRSATPVRPSDS